MTPLDPSIVERYAEHLQGRASARIMAHTIVFALFGSILGSVPLLAPNRVLIPHSLGIALLLVGAAAGGYLGYTIGVRRAEGFRLQALMTLHQLQVELLLVPPSSATGAAAFAPARPLVAAPAVAPPAPAAVAVVAPAPAVRAPAPVAPAPAPVAPAPPPAMAAPVLAPRPAPSAPVSPALPPLSVPAPPPTHHDEPLASPPPGSAASPAQQPPLVPPLVAAPELPTVPRLVEAPPAGPPTMMPPISVER